MTAAANGRFEELVRRYPDMPNVHYAFGVVLLNAEPDRAIEEFKQELQRTPGARALDAADRLRVL